MFDLSFYELAIVLAIAILLIRPEDLPDIMCVVGKFIGKVKRTIREISKAIELAAGQEEFDEIKTHVTSQMEPIIDMEGNIQPTFDIEELQDTSKHTAKKKQDDE